MSGAWVVGAGVVFTAGGVMALLAAADKICNKNTRMWLSIIGFILIIIGFLIICYAIYRLGRDIATINDKLMRQGWLTSGSYYMTL